MLRNAKRQIYSENPNTMLRLFSASLRNPRLPVHAPVQTQAHRRRPSPGRRRQMKTAPNFSRHKSLESFDHGANKFGGALINNGLPRSENLAGAAFFPAVLVSTHFVGATSAR